MAKKAIITAFVQAACVFLLTKFVEGIENGKYPLFELIFNKGAVSFLSIHKKPILSILIVVNILVYLYSNWDKFYPNNEELYDNICKAVFNATITSNAALKNSNFRVSLFKVKNGLIFDKSYSKGLFPMRATYLVNVGRHQTRQQKSLSKIRFLPNEGAVGKCFYVGELFFTSTCSSSSAKYEEEQVKKTNLPKYKVEKIKEKSSVFVAMPLRHSNSDDISGVIIIDSSDRSFDVEKVRNVEDLMIYCSVFFKKG